LVRAYGTDSTQIAGNFGVRLEKIAGKYKMLILSKERGVDPILSQCFICLKDKNEIILAGAAGSRIRENAGAHPDARSLCFNKEPCDECKKFMEQGIILISVKAGSDHENPYRTGGWCVVTEEFAKRVLLNYDVNNRVAFVEDEAWDKIGLPRNDKEENSRA